MEFILETLVRKFDRRYAYGTFGPNDLLENKKNERNFLYFYIL